MSAIECMYFFVLRVTFSVLSSVAQSLKAFHIAVVEIWYSRRWAGVWLGFLFEIPWKVAGR